MISSISSGFFQRLPILMASSKAMTAKALLFFNIPSLLFAIGLSYAQHRGFLQKREYSWYRGGGLTAGVFVYNFLLVIILKIQLNAFLVFSMLAVSLGLAFSDKFVRDFFRRRDPANENQSLSLKQGVGNEPLDSIPSTVAELELENKELNDQLGSQKAQTNTLTNTVDSLHKQLKQEQKDKDVLTEQVKKLEAERELLQQEAAERVGAKNIEVLCMKVKSLEQEIINASEIPQRQEDLRRQIKEIQQKLKLKEILLVKLNQETEKPEEEQVLQENKLARKKEKLKGLEQELEKLEGYIQSFEQAYEDARRELLQAEEEREQNIRITEEELERLKEALQSLEAQKEQSTKKTTTIVRRVSSYIWGYKNK